MFEQLFPQQTAATRNRLSPFAVERERYLSKLMEEGRSLQTLRNIAFILMYLARHLPLPKAEITPVEIEASAEAWAMTTRRSARCFYIGKREFVFHATNWMRLLGRLREPEVNRLFAAEADAFLQFAHSERGFSPAIPRRRICLAPESTSTRFVHGSGTSPSTPPTSMPKLIWKGKHRRRRTVRSRQADHIGSGGETALRSSCFFAVSERTLRQLFV